MEPGADQSKRTVLLFIALVPMFLISSLLIEARLDGRRFDFAAYWQASHMILAGEDVYDSRQWIAERTALGTALHSESTFQYPLPFAILLVPFGLLPVGTAYTLWIFLNQVSILASILILLGFHPAERPPALELVAIGGVFLFRPTFSAILSGQILALLLLCITLSIHLFKNEKWSWGGAVLSLTLLKPSVGLPLLLLVAVWLAFKKRWAGVAGILSGAIALFLVGALYNPHWVQEYLATGRGLIDKYHAMQTTLWGLSGFLFGSNPWGAALGLLAACGVLALEGYLLTSPTFADSPFLAMASILPAALLATPYSWSYDQFLLIVSIIYVLTHISVLWGVRGAALFMFAIIAAAAALVALAYSLGNDVWSLLVSAIIWASVLFFASAERFRPSVLPSTVPGS